MDSLRAWNARHQPDRLSYRLAVLLFVASFLYLMSVNWAPLHYWPWAEIGLALVAYALSLALTALRRRLGTSRGDASPES